MITRIALIFLFFPCFASGKTLPCGDGSKPVGKESKIVSDSVPLREGPGASYLRVVNEKTTKILGKRIFADVGTSATVMVECTNGKWAYVRVIDPDYLSESHRGWFESKFLKKAINVKIRSEWYSDWSYDFRLDLTKLLANKKVTGCGQYKYRNGISNKDFYIVACSSDGSNWSTYSVSLSKGTVERVGR